MTAFSLLDLAIVTEGGSVREALQHSRALAQHAEKYGYKRFWMAEHHNMVGIASAATAVSLGYVAEGTSTIRIGAAGVMLPNHAPLVVAEQFGTLAALYPGRVDLGIGRAPGTDQETMRALRRDYMSSVDRFPQDVQELIGYFEPASAGQRVRAVPGEGLRVPVWILGSSLYGAQLAAALGLPYAFASHFAPDMLEEALAIYRRRFQPSAYLNAPYAAATVNVFGADSEEEGQRLKTSMVQQFVALRRGTPGRLKPPVDQTEAIGTSIELAQARHALKESAVGTEPTVRRWLAEFLERTDADELIFSAPIYDYWQRLRSVEIAARAVQSLDRSSAARA